MGRSSGERWECCGSDAVVQWSESKKRHRISANYCKSRHCEPCARSRGNLIAANLRGKLAEVPAGKHRFVTLTLRHTDTPLRSQIVRLYAAFKRLRASKWWKGIVTGGAFTCEVKWNPDTARWHPHLHIVCDSAWLPVQELSQNWKRITIDSFRVDVQLLSNVKDASYYLAKYVAKGTSAAVWEDADRAQEYIMAMRGVRICATFGTWRGVSLTKPNDRTTDWVAVERLEVLINRAAVGESNALHILTALQCPGTVDTT